ncbi:MAG: hypothetical protein JJU00_15275 [Opitutales bacterium]|nr:hypothetical protein [Opitutales bacterium]
MSVSAEDLKSRIRARIPERRILLAPTDTFYSHRFEIPEDVAPADRRGAIALLLEGESPFPMEQLHWGFLFDAKAHRAFVYAAPHARLAKLGMNDISGFFHAFPGFVTVLGDTFTRRTVRFVAENGSVAAVYFEPGESIPARVAARRVNDEFMSDEAILATREKLAKVLPADEEWAAEEGVFVGEGIFVEGERRIVCRHRRLLPGASTRKTETAEDSEADEVPPPAAGETRERPLALDHNAVWDADIRPPTWGSKARKDRRTSRYIYKATVAAVFFLSFLLLLQAFHFGLGVYNANRAERITTEQPRVQRINDTWALASRLTQSTEQDLAPFRMLELINNVRPESVYFTRVRSTVYNELRVEGLSNAVRPVNAYADRLNQLDYIRSAETVVETRENRTRFDLTVRFSEIPRPEEAAAARDDVVMGSDEPDNPGD